MKVLILIFGFSTLFLFDFASAEPWLSNRFAQNCASCHAPGRLNRKPSKRRCTLSCQGCHVNPNGGGLRNEYGKWNSERWVRSFYTDIAWNKKTPAPLKAQKYMKKDLSKKRKLRNAKFGERLVKLKGIPKDHKHYFESTNYQPAKNKVDELNRITRDDPYRTERRNMVTAGGDLRLFFIQQAQGAPSDKLEKGTFYPMVFDFGVRVRPIKENLSFVYEGRAVNTNLQDPASMDRLFAGAAFTRSAYLLVDDLWYNSYVQYGFFRPMFGIYNPNHNAMMTDYTSMGVRTRVKALGMGASPNVPFAIVNIIQPTEGAPTGDISAEGGYNATLGLRFVRMGGNIQFSYWDTENNTALTPTKRNMWNISAGAALGRFIVNGEVTSVRREAAGLDETKILGVDTKFRFWREMYLQASYTQANAAVARNNLVNGTGISPGSGTEMAAGFRAFTISGLQFETLWANKTNKEDGHPDFNEETLSIQMHAYF